MSKKTLHLLVLYGIAATVLLILVRHFQLGAVTPDAPGSSQQGLLGD